MKKIEPFLLVIKDEDKKVFSIEGPMSDDRPWNTRVCAAQDEGRMVRCFAANGMDRQEVTRRMKAQFGYEEVDTVPLPWKSN